MTKRAELLALAERESLRGYWPIPLSPTSGGLLHDDAREGAATGLLALMTGISEEFWAAGWMSGLEYSCWQAREKGPFDYGKMLFTQRQCDLLRLLSEEADGWWYWSDDGPRFAPLDNWTAHVRALAEKKA